MRKPQEGEFHPYYQAYIDQVDDNDFIEALKDSTDEVVDWLENVPPQKENHAYEDGKWTIKQVARHIIDVDLVFIYRAVTIARNDKTSLPGFEQNDWAAAADLSQVSLSDLISEFIALRNFAIYTLSQLTETDLFRIGDANGSPTTPNSLGFIMAGHSLHHLKVLEERY
jgi:uncharacterized damage-inducible protein DinB